MIDTKALLYCIADARAIIERGVELMTVEQIGEWAGVRLWLSQSPYQYHPERDTELAELKARIQALEALVIEADSKFNRDGVASEIGVAELSLVSMCVEGREAMDKLALGWWGSMRKAMRIILTIIIVILAIALSSCGGGGNGYDATATYGAEQFHIQLTAEAK